METITIALAITIINCVLGIITFASNKKKEAVQSAKEMNMDLINYRLNELDKNVQKLLEKVDYFYSDVDSRIDERIKRHEEMYHKK